MTPSTPAKITVEKEHQPIVEEFARLLMPQMLLGAFYLIETGRFKNWTIRSTAAVGMAQTISQLLEALKFPQPTEPLVKMRLIFDKELGVKKLHAHLYFGEHRQRIGLPLDRINWEHVSQNIHIPNKHAEFSKALADCDLRARMLKVLARVDVTLKIEQPI